jgi:hypothetical protein
MVSDSDINIDEKLRALRARGFRFMDPRDEWGNVVAVVGVRAHDDVIDVVRLHAEDDVVASRLPCDADILAPATVFWQHKGPAGEVLGKLLDLPDDRVPGSLAVATGTRARWPGCR